MKNFMSWMIGPIIGSLIAGLSILSYSYSHKITDLFRNERTYWTLKEVYCLDAYKSTCGMNLSSCWKKKTRDPFTMLCVKEYQEIKLKLGEEAK